MTESARDAIVAANEAFMAATRQGDAAGVAALYTTDAKVLPPNKEKSLAGSPPIQPGFLPTRTAATIQDRNRRGPQSRS